jgi:hypothetical protein
MMFRRLLVLILLLPLTCFGQYTISGRVLNADDKAPVADASVFLNNSVVGDKTDKNGNFHIIGVRPGQYDLVISIVGFETYHHDVFVNNDIKLADISIKAQVMMLKDVTIKPRTDWPRIYEKFKRYFLGESGYADQCKILNPDVLDLDYDRVTHVLTAKSDGFIEIENKGLGYKIRYLLADMKTDEQANISSFNGSASFENLPGTESQQKRWKKNRFKAFEGSSMHFLRSTLNNTFESEGFRVMKLVRKPNPQYHGGYNYKYLQTLVTSPLEQQDFLKLTDIKGQYALGYSDCLYIIYDKKKAYKSIDKNKIVMDMPDYITDPGVSIIAFNEPYAYFDRNGIISNAGSVIFDGNWGKRLTADLLPVDYVPDIEE